jgi:hypothetical protein
VRNKQTNDIAYKPRGCFVSKLKIRTYAGAMTVPKNAKLEKVLGVQFERNPILVGKL